MIFTDLELLDEPIMVLLLVIFKIANAMTGTIRIVKPWANTMSLRRKSLNANANDEPTTMSSMIRSLVDNCWCVFPKPSVSAKTFPPKVALPIREENEAANKPIIKMMDEVVPKSGSSAFPISATLFTEIPFANKTLPEAISTSVEIKPKSIIPVMLSVLQVW